MEKILSTPLDDKIIREYYLPDARILTYDEIENYNTIEELLPNERDYVIILYPVDSLYSGHWTCTIRNKGTIEHFDSYRIYPDKELKFIDKQKRLELDVDVPFLSNLYNKTKMRVVYNNVKYQSDDPQIQTCGRHVIFRIIQFLYNDLDLKGYCKLMKGLKKNMKLNYDQIVSYFINK